MVKRQYIDNTETMRQYAEFLSHECNVPVVHSSSFHFDSSDEGRASQDRLMERIQNDGCYGYGISLKDGVRRLTLHDLSILVRGLKQWCKTLIELDCLVVKEGEFTEDFDSVRHMDETIQQAYLECQDDNF